MVYVGNVVASVNGNMEIYLALGSQANRPHGHQRSCTAIEGQIDSEEDVGTVAVEIYRQVDPFRRFVGLDPANLGRIQFDRLPVVEYQLVVHPRCTL